MIYLFLESILFQLLFKNGTVFIFNNFFQLWNGFLLQFDLFIFSQN